MPRAFPEAYLQPDPRKDCGFYAAAYIARCAGFPGATAADVMAWCESARFGDVHYAARAHGAEMCSFADAEREGGEDGRRPFWLGPGGRPWLEERLCGGWIAMVQVNRIREMSHAVVALECSGAGVLLMDPVYGHMTEPWEWLLGPGGKAGRSEWPGRAPDGRQFFGAHFVEGLYRMPVVARGCSMGHDD